jgi:hypothetical protein
MTDFVIHINSNTDRTTVDTDTASWTTFLYKAIQCAHGNKLKMAVESVELPNTVYSFSPYENTIWWIHDYGGTNVLRSVTIATDRTYDSTNFATYLNSLMSASSYLLTFAYDNNTGRLTLTNNQAVPIRLIGSYRYGETAANNAADKLGFTQSLLTTSIAAAGTLNATGVLRLLRTNCYYLTCDSIGSRVSQGQVPTPYEQPRIIAKIQASNFGTLSQIRNGSSLYYDVSEKDIKSLAFSVLDDQLYPVSFNGCPITFTLRVEVI